MGLQQLPALYHVTVERKEFEAEATRAKGSGLNRQKSSAKKERSMF
jgi:hypothetical protein